MLWDVHVLGIAMLSSLPTQYADPTPAHLKMMRVIPDRYRGAFEGITVPPPPSGEIDMRSEMRLLLKHTRNPALGERFCQAVDRDIVPAVLLGSRILGIEADPDEMREVVDGLVPAILRMKYAFNQPRPWQVSPALGSQLNVVRSPSSETPSYPSGHAIQAAVACSLLADRNPHAARGLDKIASAIAQSRLEMGIHFPSDVIAGLRLGRQIADRIS